MGIAALAVLIGCGGGDEKKVDNALLSAKTFLTAGDCQSAITSIESISYQAQNLDYLKTRASAYACRAGFEMTRLFDQDLSKIGDPSVLGGLARFTTSASMTEPRHSTYEDLLTAIDTLLYAGGIPRYRADLIGARKAAFNRIDLEEAHLQTFYFLLAQLGKYVYYYGNSSTAGVKGGGGGSNTCFLFYDNLLFADNSTDLETYLSSGNTGACEDRVSGNPFLGTAGDLNIERMCQGVVLLNNFREIFTEISSIIGDIADLDALGEIDGLFDAADTVFANATGTLSERVLGVQSQQVCEELNADDNDALQFFFALYFEGLFQ